MANQDTDHARREQQIAVAAYYNAEKRGFGGNRELDDWLEAEKHLDSMTAAKGTKSEASQLADPQSEPALDTAGDVLRTDLEDERVEPDNIHEWAERLHASPTMLREAIKRAGPLVRDVKNELNSIKPV